MCLGGRLTGDEDDARVGDTEEEARICCSSYAHFQSLSCSLGVFLMEVTFQGQSPHGPDIDECLVEYRVCTFTGFITLAFPFPAHGFEASRDGIHDWSSSHTHQSELPADDQTPNKGYRHHHCRHKEKSCKATDKISHFFRIAVEALR